MNQPRISLDQWRAFVAVVDNGGYARAAKALNLSQSAVSYGVSRVQELLGIALLRVEGRRSVLTPAGEALLPRVRRLLADAGDLEEAAGKFGRGWEARVLLVTDVLAPSALVLDTLRRFRQQAPQVQVLVREEVLSGTEQVLSRGEAGLGLHARVPEGCAGEVVSDIEMLLVAAPEHALHHMGMALQVRDLERATQIFIRDTGSAPREEGETGSWQRWTAGSRETALEMVRQGFGFCWAPRHWVERDLASGAVLPLPMRIPEKRRIPLYLVYAPEHYDGPAVRLMGQCIREAAGFWGKNG